MRRAELVNLGDGLGGRVSGGDGAGSGTVLWVHGYTLDSSSWSHLWERLPGYRHVGVDLPGHGASLPLGPGEDLPSLARRFNRLAERRGARHLVALSFGTLVALQMAIESPNAFTTVALGAPALGGGPQDEDVGRRYAELAAAFQARGFGPHLRELWMSSPPDIFKGAESRPELWRELWLTVGRHAWWELGDGSYGRLANHVQPPARLRAIQSALLLLVGENEFPAFKRCAEMIRRPVPVARRVYLPDVGHLCMLEAPEATAPLLAEHLDSHAAAPARGSHVA